MSRVSPVPAEHRALDAESRPAEDRSDDVRLWTAANDEMSGQIVTLGKRSKRVCYESLCTQAA